MQQPQNRLNLMTQVGVVVRDLDRIEENMLRIFGLRPYRRVGGIHTNATLYGEPCDRVGCNCIFYNFCNVEIEYIQPVTEQNVWCDFLREHGEGIHHVGFSVDSHDGVRGDMAAAGVPCIQSGDIYRGVGLSYAYYGTLPLIGFDIETNDDLPICYWRQVSQNYAAQADGAREAQGPCSESSVK